MNVSAEKKCDYILTFNKENSFNEIEENLNGISANLLKATEINHFYDLLSKKEETVNVIVIDSEDNETSINILKKLKNHKSWSHIPAILLTSQREDQEIVHCVDAGVYYCLHKPYSPDLFRSVMNKAIKDYTNYMVYIQKVKSFEITHLIKEGFMEYKSLKEGYAIADWLASMCANQAREDIVVGFIELLTNAVEHGNLGIGYDEKSDLMKKGNYINHIVQQIESDDHKDKFVRIDFKRSDEALTVTITDMGKGFDYKKYLVFDKRRLFHTHGKGIYMANKLYFNSIEYHDPGNSVTVIVQFKPQ